MKTCAACHEDLPKDKFSKKQWKLNQRRCKVCFRDNREMQQLPTENNEPGDSEVESLSLSSMSLNDCNTPITDEELFKQPPKNEEDCPICFLRMPSLDTGYKYKSCCGKVICSGCIYANSKLHEDDLCPFCRTPTHTTDKEAMMRNKKRVEMKDPMAIYSLGCKYDHGTYGCLQDYAKAFELWHRAAELGHISAYYHIGNASCKGEGVERDMKKAIHYWELAAMLGHVGARYNLGAFEYNERNMDRALKHWMLAAGLGHNGSLKQIKQLFMNGHAKKEDYATALRDHQTYLGEVKSDQRDKAAAARGDYRYY